MSNNTQNQQVDSEHNAASQYNYWKQFGLNQPPFEESLQYVMYFSLPQWRTCLDYLQSIANTNKPIVSISGVSGSGKSMLAAQYLAQTENDVKNYLLKGSSVIRANQLLEIITEAFDIKENITDKTIPNQVDAIITHLQTRHISYVLIIDNAHRLPLETLSILISLAGKQTPNEIALYIVLLGEPQMQPRIENLLDVVETELDVGSFQLQPLTFDETKNYLRHRLVKAGSTEKLPFDDAMVRRIFELSGGIPGRINRVARQALVDIGMDDAEKVKPVAVQKNKHTWASVARAHKVKFISLGLLIVLAAVFWNYPWGINRHTPQSSNVVLKQITNEQTQRPFAQQVSQPVIKKQSTTITNNESKTASPAPVQQQNITSTVLAAQNQSQTVESTAAANAPKTEATSVSTGQTAQQTTEPSYVVASTNQESVQATTQSPINSSYRDMENRLLSMNGYVLQLIGMYNESDMRRFINEHGLGDDSLYFRTTHNGKPWYVVLYGPYTTLQKARDAKANLPANLSKQKPWIRPLGPIQNAIRTEG